MSSSRRNFFRNAAVFGTGLLGWSESLRAQMRGMTRGGESERSKRSSKKKSSVEPVRMITPDVVDLPHEMDGNTKVFRLVAEPVKQKVVPWKTLEVWGYNGRCPGPTIQVTQGDRVRVIFENRLPESTSMHWHGLELPIDQDGVPWISQKPTAPGETFTYEFTVHQEGTFFYHAHSTMQEMMGLIGIFVAHPKKKFAPRVDHDYGIVLQEWAVLPSNSVPNNASIKFN